MTSDIDDAIDRRLEVEFAYDGQPRVVQPAAHGTHKDTGNEVLRGYRSRNVAGSTPKVRRGRSRGTGDSHPVDGASEAVTLGQSRATIAGTGCALEASELDVYGFG